MSTTSKTYMSSSINSRRSGKGNTSTSKSSDSNSTGMNFLIESSSSSSRKNKKRQTTKDIKGIIRVIDDPKDHASDFQMKPLLQRDIKEQLKKLKDLREDCKKIMMSYDNKCKNVTEETTKTQLEKVLKEVYSVSLRIVENYAEYHMNNSDLALKKCCRVLKRLEKGHCKGMLHIHDISKELPFIYNMVDQMNIKLNRPVQYCEDSSSDILNDISAFKLDAQCMIQKDDECSNDNENILKSTIRNHFSAFDLDQIADASNSIKSKALQKLVSIIQQYNFFIEK